MTDILSDWMRIKCIYAFEHDVQMYAVLCSGCMLAAAVAMMTTTRDAAVWCVCGCDVDDEAMRRGGRRLFCAVLHIVIECQGREVEVFLLRKFI